MEVLTHSKRQAFLTCPRYYFHHNVEHLALRAARKGRRRGTMFGEALFHCQQKYEAGREAQEIYSLSVYQEIINSFLQQAYDTILETESGITDAEELELEMIKVRVMAYLYVAEYGIDRRREIEFSLPLKNPATNRTSQLYKLGGKIDGAVVLKPKHVQLIEDKFVGQIQKAMIDRLPLDLQVSEYVDAFRQMGWRVEVAYRHTRYPGINPKPAKTYKTKDDYPGETLDEFEERLIEDVFSRKEFYFDQQILWFPDEHMAEFRQERWNIAQSIKNLRGKPITHYVKNPSRCWEYGGCEYIPLCTKLDGARDLYVVQDENPELSVVTAEYGQEEQ